MFSTIVTTRQARGLALAATAALLLASGTALAQVADVSGDAPGVGIPSNAAPVVGPTGLPFGATETAGGGLGPVPFDTTSGLAPLGSDVTSTMGMGSLGATETGTGGLSPVPLDTTSALPSLGTGMAGTTSIAGTGTGTISTGSMMSLGGFAATGTTIPGISGPTSPLGSAFAPVTTGAGSSTLSPGITTPVPGVANTAVTNFGLGGMQPLPGSPRNGEP
jgi:hypothetical protein